MTDTRHLDTALSILRGSEKAKRAKTTMFTLYVGTGTLQGPRGKTVKTFVGTPDEIVQSAKEHAARAGGDLTIYD